VPLVLLASASGLGLGACSSESRAAGQTAASVASAPAASPSSTSSTSAALTTAQPITTEAPTTSATPTTTIDEQSRKIAVRRFVELYEADLACRSGQCANGPSDPPTREERDEAEESPLGADMVDFRSYGRMTQRLKGMRDAALDIPGPELAEYVASVKDWYHRWSECIDATSADTQEDRRRACAVQEDALRRAFEDLYFLVSD